MLGQPLVNLPAIPHNRYFLVLAIGHNVLAALLDETSKNAASGSADPADESIATKNANFYSFCRPAGLLHDTVPTPPSKPGRVGSNGEPPSERQPPGTTRTRRHPWFLERRVRRQRWRKEWKWVRLHRIERAPRRGRRGGQEPGVKRERRTLLRNRRGHWQPKRRYEVKGEFRGLTGEGAGRGTFGAGL